MTTDYALLPLRATVGPLMVGHGAGKLFGVWNAGYGIAGTAGYVESLGFRPGKPWAVLSGATEFAAGLGIATGLLTPLAGAGLIGVMSTAAATAHAGKGPWVTNGGWEYPLVLGAVGAVLSFTGPGRYSLDGALGLRLEGARWGFGALAIGLASTVAALAIRQQPTPEPTPADPTAAPPSEA